MSFMKNLIKSFPLFIALCISLLGFDYLAPLSIYPLYLVPIFLVSRHNDYAPWLCIPLFTILSILAENNSIYNFSSFEAFYVFIFRSFVLYLLSYLLISFSSTLDQSRRRFDRLKQLLPICAECGSLYCPDGKWRSLDSLLEDPQIFKCPSHLDCLNSSDLFTSSLTKK